MSGTSGIGNRGVTSLAVSSEVVQNSLERAERLLAAINGGVYRAMGSAAARALAAGKTAAKAAVAQEYAISQGEFLKHTTNTNHHYGRASSGDMVWQIGYAGYVIPLLKFKTRPGSNGRLQTQVKRANAPEVLRHAFKAKIFGHDGVFERQGDSRFPVQELYGPAGPQMMSANENVLNKVDARVAEVFERRLEHEINAILQGWRG